MKYDAFISYKHEKLDTEAAKKLHSALETYHIPKAVQKKTGKKKIERVFRDEEELPIGSDLNEKILTALKNSKYLIVVCSRETRNSSWVSQEIDTFISLHGRKKILAVLIDGEPDSSFPPQILKDDKGNPVEPLAADIRGNSKNERKKKFKTEIIRLLAPIIGCSYDDLKQRHRERLIKRNIAVGIGLASVIAIAGMSFGIYNRGVAHKMKKLANEKDALASEKTELAAEKTELAAEKTELAAEKTELANNILAEYEQKLENQSRFYAEKSLSVLAEGNRKDAALIAMEGLPKYGDERPFVAEAEYALSEALHAYDCGAYLASDALLEHRYSVVRQELSAGGDKLITSDLGDYIYVWDTKTWELLCEISPNLGNNNYIGFICNTCADEGGIYVGERNSVHKFDYEGTLKKSLTFLGIPLKIGIIPGTESLFVIDPMHIYVIDENTFDILHEFENPVGMFFSSECHMSQSGVLAVKNYFEGELDGSVSIIDFRNYELKTIKAAENFIMTLFMPDDDHICILSSDYDPALFDSPNIVFDYIEIASGKQLLSKNLQFKIFRESEIHSFIRTQAYVQDDYKSIQIVVIVGDEEFSFDAEDGKMLSYMTLSDTPTSLITDAEDDIAYIGYENGLIDQVDFYVGKVDSDNKINTGIEISDMIALGEQMTIASPSSEFIYVMKYHKAPDLEELSSIDYDISLCALSKDDDCFLAKENTDEDTYYLINSSGEKVQVINNESKAAFSAAFYKDKFISVLNNTISVTDYKNNKTVSYPLEELGYSGGGFMTDFSESGRYLCIHGLFNLAVLDLEEMKLLYQKSSEKIIEAVAVSDFGDYIYVSYMEQNLTKININTGTEIRYEDDSLRQTVVLNGYDRMKLSPDGKKLAVYCMDETMKIINTGDGSTIFSFYYISKNKFFVGFFDKGNKVIVQGEDNNLTMIDLKYKEMIRSMNVDSAIICMVEDEKGYIAIFSGRNTYLLDCKSYGMVAKVSDAVAYMKNDSSFILENGGCLYKCHYKNYKVLMEEADRQFPYAELDIIKRSRYNIE